MKRFSFFWKKGCGVEGFLFRGVYEDKYGQWPWLIFSIFLNFWNDQTT